MIYNPYSDEILHYGVLGMKWGVRKDKETSGTRKISKPNLAPTSGFAKASKNLSTDVGRCNIDSLNNTPKGKALTKKVLDMIGEANEGRYESTSEAKRTLDNLPKQKEIDDGRAFDFIPKSNRLDKMDYKAQLLATNHDANTPMRNINCFECSLAYEMRRRGYDVQAKQMNGGLEIEVEHAFNIKDSFLLKMEPKSEYTNDKEALAKEAYKQLERQCLDYGEGARGCLGIQYYDYDGGHSMFWVVEDGEFKILDTQHNGKNGYETFLHAETVDNSIGVYRLDNADVLPGVTDFVEPFENSEEVQEELAKKSVAKVKAQEKAKEKAKKKAAKKAKANNFDIKKLISDASKATKEFVSDGAKAVSKFLKNPLNIQKKS